MKKYDLVKLTGEIKDKRNIKTLCCIDDTAEEVIASFGSLEEALEELKKAQYEPSCRYMPWTVPFYKVKEYAVVEYEVDEDGEFIGTYVSYYDYYVYEFDDEENDIKIKK